MQVTDLQHHSRKQVSSSDRVGDSSISTGCISKKEISNFLYPNRSYRSSGVRIFFTEERLQRCGISPDEFRRIRVFSAQATHVIISDLQQFGFIK